MRVHEFDCFGEKPGAGNPALVVEEGNSNPGWRRALARERGLTCVFVDPVDGRVEAQANVSGDLPDGEPAIVAVLDYVYPHMRSPYACTPLWRRRNCCSSGTGLARRWG